MNATTGAASPATKARNAFALDLMRALSDDDPAGNLVFSPHSIYSVLAMLAEGAAGETAEEMGAALRLPPEARRAGRGNGSQPWNLATVHAELRDLTVSLASPGGRTPSQMTHLAQVAAEEERIQGERCRLLGAGLPPDVLRDRMQMHQVLSDALRHEMHLLGGGADRFRVSLANAIWCERTLTVRAPFVRTIEQHYGAGTLATADFRSDPEGACTQINNWVRERTGQLISDIVSPGSINPLTRLVLANAAHLKAEWADPFSQDCTVSTVFERCDGKHSDVQMMSNCASIGYAAFRGDGSYFDTPLEVPAQGGGRISRLEEMQMLLNTESGRFEPPYPEPPGFQIAELPYAGDSIAMVVILPRSAKDLPVIERLINPALWSGWMERLERRTGEVHLPKFQLEATLPLTEPLRVMGMRRAFMGSHARAGADFSGIALPPTTEDGLFLNAAIHQAFLRVDERGTEAGAATALGMLESTSDGVPYIPVVRLDHPFLFFIRDRISGSVLFAGRMARP